MKTKQIWANFSVADASRTHQFYTILGFTANNTGGTSGLASFRFGDNGFVIHFFERGTQIDKYLAPGAGHTGEIIFTLSAATEAEVNEMAERVKSAGGSMIQEVGRDENNYFGFAFADPDGHRFNVLLMESHM
jgi:hypothetical protein